MTETIPTKNTSAQPANLPPRNRVALLRATAAEVVGAGMHVAGLSVVERSIRQMDQMGVSIILGSDGSCILPKYLPPSVILRKVPRPDDLTALRNELSGAVEMGANEVRPSNRSLDRGIKVTDDASRTRAETAVFAELMRGDLGFVAHYLNKPVSFFITRHILCHLPFTPDHITIGAAAVGLLGAALIASGNYALMIWGFFLAHVQSILDGCDGELARVRFQQSTTGEWLDTMADDLLNIVIFAALGVGLYRMWGSTILLFSGFAAAALHLVYDAVALVELQRQGDGGEIIKVHWRIAGKDNMKTRLTQQHKSPMVLIYSMGRRDFFILAFLIYALLGLPKLALIHAMLVAGSLCVVALTQVLWRLRGSPK